MVLSGARTGPCKALRWREVEARYVCGAIVDPATVLPGWLQWTGMPIAKLLPRLALRWVAAGQGCDSSLEPLGPPSATIDARPISGVSKTTTD